MKILAEVSGEFSPGDPNTAFEDVPSHWSVWGANPLAQTFLIQGTDP